MGIRIKRQIGFALTDVQLDSSGEIDDPRIMANYDEPYEKDLKDYPDFCKENLDKILTPEQAQLFTPFWGWNPDILKRSPYQFVARSYNELNLTTDDGKGVFLITPVLMYDSWRHYDDSFDYYDYYKKLPASDADNLKGIIEPLEYNPYPYDGKYMDKRTYQGVGWEIERFLEDTNFDWDSLSDGEKEIYFEKRNFRSYEELTENAIWKLPVELHVFSKWLGLFTSDDIWLQLRPTMITYWS